MSKDEKRTLTTGDVARYCHVTPVTVFNWIKAGKLQSFTTAGGHNRILPEDFRAFLVANLMPVPPDLLEKPNRSLLVVDDEPAIVQIVERAAAKTGLGLAVESAGNGYEACLKLGRKPAAVLFVDLRMPGMDGLELCRALRAAEVTRRVRIVVVSGYRDEESTERLAELGVDRFLDKPFTGRDVETLLRELFA